MERPGLAAREIAKIVLTALAIVGVLYFVYLIREIITLVLISVFLAIALTPVVNVLDRGRFPRWAAILSVYLTIVLGIFGIGLAVVPPVVNGVNDLVHNLPRYVADLRDNKTFRKYDEKYDIVDKLQKEADKLPTRIGDAAGTLRDVIVGVFTRAVQLLTALVITFILILDGRRFHPTAISVFTFGMAHKLHTEMFLRLRELLETSELSWAVYVSSANHETASIRDGEIVFQEVKKLFPSGLYFLGNLSDVAIYNYLQNTAFFAAFFEGGVRANNGTVAAAMEHGAVVITNLDRYSPPEYVHMENLIDINRCQRLPSDPMILKSIAAEAMAYPIFPEERLLRKRIGSIGSRVGPAVMTNFTRSIDRAGAKEIPREKRCPPLSKDARGLRNRRRACPLPDR